MKDSLRTPAWGARSETGTLWSFALWAPPAQTVVLDLEGRSIPMQTDGAGHWSVSVEAQAGQTYEFVVDGTAYPDPAARQQRDGVHGASVLTEIPSPPTLWSGRDWAEAVVFEMHLGTFTDAGTLQAAGAHLGTLAELGITFVELMPIAQFYGRHGWGYDGVLPYALHKAYGTPDDLREFIDRAHALGMGVLLDVVYNHFGPEGAYLHAYCPDFFHADKSSPWGSTIDFSHPETRLFFLENAEMWIRDYGIDGLRLDAVHAIHDESSPHFLEELTHRIKSLDLGRPVHLIAEDESNTPDLREAGMDAAWNDDYHHAVHCLLTGEDEGYYAAFAVDPMDDLCLALERGQVEEGQPRRGKDAPRGASAGHLPVTAFVNANQTHDQVGNRAKGERLITLVGPKAMMPLHGLLLTAPYIPMLFMGEELGARAPFQFFCDFDGDLAEAVRNGRAAEFSAFAGFTGEVPDPCAVETMQRSRPYADPPSDAAFWQEWTATLLQYRAEKIVPLLKTDRLDSKVRRVGSRAVEATWTFEAGSLRLAANLGTPPDVETDWSEADLQHGRSNEPFAFMCRVTS